MLPYSIMSMICDGRAIDGDLDAEITHTVGLGPTVRRGKTGYRELF